MKDFDLTGMTDFGGNKFNARLTLRTPDGQVTTIDSGFIYLREEEANQALMSKLEQIKALFKKEGIKIISEEKGTLQ